MENMHFNVANVIPLCSHIGYVASSLHMRQSFFPRRFIPIHIFTVFNLATQCNKFPGATLNINLLLCWLPFHFSHFVFSFFYFGSETRMLAAHKWHTESHWEACALCNTKPGREKNVSNIFLYELANGLIYFRYAVIDDMHFSIQHPKFNARQCFVWHTQPLTFRFFISRSRLPIGWISFLFHSFILSVSLSHLQNFLLIEKCWLCTCAILPYLLMSNFFLCCLFDSDVWTKW